MGLAFWIFIIVSFYFIFGIELNYVWKNMHFGIPSIDSFITNEIAPREKTILTYLWISSLLLAIRNFVVLNNYNWKDKPVREHEGIEFVHFELNKTLDAIQSLVSERFPSKGKALARAFQQRKIGNTPHPYPTGNILISFHSF
jgi:hypothetical protein